jgi:hypothetical protein
VIKKAMEEKAKKSNDVEELERINLDQFWEIIDITFSRTDDKEIEIL